MSEVRMASHFERERERERGKEKERERERKEERERERAECFISFLFHIIIMSNFNAFFSFKGNESK
jgi:hypothetical protein